MGRDGRGVGLRDQLEAMKISQLKKRAKGTFGVQPDQLSAADSSQDRKGALIELILSKDKGHAQVVQYPSEQQVLMMVSVTHRPTARGGSRSRGHAGECHGHAGIQGSVTEREEGAT